jgi:RecB family endonuclease NucS
MPKMIRYYRERKIQRLLRAHPYLLDEDLSTWRGRIERSVGNGRLDIDFDTEKGWIIVECKVVALTNKHLRQLCRYLHNLAQAGKEVHRAYLVGRAPKKELQTDLLQRSPGICVKHIFRDIPTFLAFSEGRHYFDADLEICPYDGTRKIVGKELSME